MSTPKVKPVYFVVCLKVKVLPEVELTTISALTTKYANKELAEISLAHIQKSVPDAFLNVHESHCVTEDERIEFAQIQARDNRLLSKLSGGES